MRNILKYGILTIALIGAPTAAFAGDLGYVPPGGNDKMVEQEDDSAFNYFSSGQHKKEEMAAQEELQQSGKGVPASQLNQLPETLMIDGKTELKVQNGQLIGGVADANYTDCDSSPSTDECVQSRGADPMITKTEAVYEEPKTLDEQLMEKEAETDLKIEANVENTAIVDKERGAKTNIISNTDTGVKLAE